MNKSQIGPLTFRRGRELVFVLAAAACVTSLRADTLTIGGTITQSTQDGTGPAVNNPSLNGIPDDASFFLDLSFTGSITSPGTIDLTGSSLLWSVPSAGAAESSFDFVSLTVTQSGVFDQVSILACLTTGSGCNQGNQLGMNFMILSQFLNAQNVSPQGIQGLLPFGLLEDDGITDIHGVVTKYSYASTSSVPEPATYGLLGIGLVTAGLTRRSRIAGKDVSTTALKAN